MFSLHIDTGWGRSSRCKDGNYSPLGPGSLQYNSAVQLYKSLVGPRSTIYRAVFAQGNTEKKKMG